jgi:hypothetical protein
MNKDFRRKMKWLYVLDATERGGYLDSAVA